MKINILSLKGTQFEGDATALNVKTTSGEITVLDNHRPLMTILAPGEATVVLPSGERRAIPVRGGFLEVRENNELVALVD